MRKVIAVLCILTLVLPVLAGCGEKTVGQGGPASSVQASAPVEANAGGVTLAEMRKAAEDSGYAVTDDYVAVFMKDVVGGFAVEIVADEQDVIYSVLECKTEDAAIQNAKDIDEAGYNIAIRNGRFLTCYGVDNKAGTVKDILAAIMAGKPVS